LTFLASRKERIFSKAVFTNTYCVVIFKGEKEGEREREEEGEEGEGEGGEGGEGGMMKWKCGQTSCR